MSGSYEIVPYTPDHKQRVAELETGLWCSDPALALRYLEWKYQENPYLPEPILYLAYRGRRLVGVRGFYGARWESGSGPLRVVATIPVADDLIVAPEERDRGVVTLLMRAALEGVARLGYRQVFNLSGSQVTVLGSLAMGWKSAGPLLPIGLPADESLGERIRATLRRTRVLWRFGRSRWLSPGYLRAPFRNLDRVSARLRPIEVTRQPRAEAMADLVDRLGTDGRIRHVRDREFFQWRYRNPLRSYRFLYVGDDRLEGYLVLKASQPGSVSPSRVRIVDLEASSASVQACLLDTTLRAMRRGGLYAWGATFPETALNRLRAGGFRPVDLAARSHGCPCVVVKTLGEPGSTDPFRFGGRNLAVLADWDLRMIATMAG